MGAFYHKLVGVVNHAGNTHFMHEWGTLPKLLFFGRGGGWVGVQLFRVIDKFCSDFRGNIFSIEFRGAPFLQTQIMLWELSFASKTPFPTSNNMEKRSFLPLKRPHSTSNNAEGTVPFASKTHPSNLNYCGGGPFRPLYPKIIRVVPIASKMPPPTIIKGILFVSKTTAPTSKNAWGRSLLHQKRPRPTSNKAPIDNVC